MLTCCTASHRHSFSLSLVRSQLICASQPPCCPDAETFLSTFTTAPPTNESAFHQWTIGPIFYSSLVVAEALGTSNTSRVKDLFPNNGDPHTPAYAVYENDQLARLVLINFLDDPSGANDYTATLNVGGQQFGEANAVPAQVKVK